MSFKNQAASCCFCFCCGYVGNAFALSKRSGISTALAAASISSMPARHTAIGVWLFIAWCGRQVFGAVAKADTDIKVLIRRSLDAVGRTEDTALTAFTDGCSGLRRILADAGVTETPVLDWFHIAMRLQHL